MLARRTSRDHEFVFGLSMRGDDFRLEFSFQPLIGTQPSSSVDLFRDTWDPGLSKTFLR